MGEPLKGTRSIDGLPLRSSEEHLPTRGDLVNVCLTVSESLRAHAGQIREAWTNGWPKVKTSNSKRKKWRGDEEVFSRDHKLLSVNEEKKQQSA